MNTGSPPNPLSSLDDMFSASTRQQWVELTLSGLKRESSDSQALQAIRSSTLDGIALEVLYDRCSPTANTTRNFSDSSSWDNRLYVSGSQSASMSEHIQRGLAGGVTSLEIHTQTPSELATILRAVNLDIAQVSLRSCQAYEACTQAFLAICKSTGISEDTLIFSANADPVSTALATQQSSKTLNKELQVAAKFSRLLANQNPSSHTMLVDVALHHNAGASTVEELHAALATATLYLEALLNIGMSVNEASNHIVFQLAMDTDVLLGIAKLRALRSLWQQVLVHFGVDDRAVKTAVVVAETSLRFHSKLEPWNNHMRNLCASKAAMIGNADTLMVHPHDTLLRTESDNTNDTDISDRMARNIAIILERECGLSKINDPMAGSYAIENITQALMQISWESLASTDTSQGWIDELLSGRWQKRLEKTQHRRVSLLQEHKHIAVGVNRFVHKIKPDDTKSISVSAKLVESSKNPHKTALLPVREAEAFELSAAQGGEQ